MTIVVVNFPLPEQMALEEYESRMTQTVPRYQGKRGLLRTNYIYDGERHVGGAVYVFESKSEAHACFSDEFVARIMTMWGPPEIRYFDTPMLIDNETKTVRELA